MASLLEEIEEIRNSEAPILNDGSDIDGDEFSEEDDFTVDERRYVDAILRWWMLYELDMEMTVMMIQSNLPYRSHLLISTRPH
ncbi:hypothetical protein RRG08_011666 [Elysia crispata]|uniref:Uncharacterized protein n=1 Tax=Elysia crispata TaxID=231223 RepID=A0AAE0YL83_9GAST|nr:hypothetical protein RRG08_011666 [Elysia crispata]